MAVANARKACYSFKWFWLLHFRVSTAVAYIVFIQTSQYIHNVSHSSLMKSLPDACTLATYLQFELRCMRHYGTWTSFHSTLDYVLVLTSHQFQAACPVANFRRHWFLGLILSDFGVETPPVNGDFSVPDTALYYVKVEVTGSNGVTASLSCDQKHSFVRGLP